MKKLANISIGICGVSIVIPRLFIMFSSADNTLLARVPWAFFILFFGVLGIVLHLIIGLQKGVKFNFQGVILIFSLLLLFTGFACLEWGVYNSKYILLGGVITLALWLILPNNKTEDNDI